MSFTPGFYDAKGVLQVSTKSRPLFFRPSWVTQNDGTKVRSVTRGDLVDVPQIDDPDAIVQVPNVVLVANRLEYAELFPRTPAPAQIE
jgi:hypothetical protein